MFMILIFKSIESDSCVGVAASLQATELGFASTLMLLSRFKDLMATDGVAVNTLEMLANNAYAFEQLALAHTSTSEQLRHCAMRVFALLRM
jgi:hypothetical protein